MQLKAVITEANKQRVINEIDHISDNPEKFVEALKPVFTDFYLGGELVGTMAHIVEGNILFLGAFIAYKKGNIFPTIFPYFIRFCEINNLEKIVLVTKRKTKHYFVKLGFELVSEEKGIKEYVFRK